MATKVASSLGRSDGQPASQEPLELLSGPCTWTNSKPAGHPSGAERQGADMRTRPMSQAQHLAEIGRLMQVSEGAGCGSGAQSPSKLKRPSQSNRNEQLRKCTIIFSPMYVSSLVGFRSPPQQNLNASATSAVDLARSPELLGPWPPRR